MAWGEQDYPRLRKNQIALPMIMKEVWREKKSKLAPEDRLPKVSVKQTAASRAIRRAIRLGTLKPKENCETCGKERDGWRKIVAHHDDYDFPLVVRWLCISCHRRWHVANGRGKNY